MPRKSNKSNNKDSSGNEEGGANYKTIDKLFDQYADRKSQMIEPAGIELLCANLNVECTDVRMLMLAWKMKAEKQAYFTKDEWRRGLQALNADSIRKLQEALPGLVQEAQEPSNFLDFCTYSFKYCLTENLQRTLDIDTTCILMNLVLGPSYRSQVDKIIEYLKSQQEYRSITLDQWWGFYRFCKEINYPSLDNYGDDDSWPTIVDELVDWLLGNQS